MSAPPRDRWLAFLTRPRSLAATGLAVMLLATGAAALLSVGLLFQRNAVVIADTELTVFEERAHGLAQGLVHTDHGWELQVPLRLAALFDPAYERSFYAVLGHDGAVLLSTFPLRTPAVLVTADLDESTAFRVRRGSWVLEGASVPVTVDGVHLIIQVADNIRHPDVITDDLEDRFLGRVSWVVLPVFLLLALAGYATLRLCLRPIEQLSRQAAVLRPGERLQEDGAPREIRPLIRAMNQAIRQGERLIAAQRDFTADAAHQMRTPLAVLMTHADLLEDQKVAAALKQDVRALERLVDQLLTLAEVDGALAEAEAPEMVDLLSLAEAVVDFLAPLAERQRVELRLLHPPGAEAWELSGYQEPLYQAILNLVQNALDHSPPEGCVTVEVAAPGIIAISDQGPGIPPHLRRLVFRRFWRAQQGREGRRGVGLGLAIVQQVAALHGGHIAVETAEGGGARFRMVLAGAEQGLPPPEATAHSPAHAPSHLNGGHHEA